jgi:hypothetical protein
VKTPLPNQLLTNIFDEGFSDLKLSNKKNTYYQVFFMIDHLLNIQATIHPSEYYLFLELKNELTIKKQVRPSGEIVLPGLLYYNNKKINV